MSEMLYGDWIGPLASGCTPTPTIQVIPASGVPAAPGANVATLLGPTVKAEATGGVVMFNDVATVTTANILVNCGTTVIHIIDTVLKPPTN